MQILILILIVLVLAFAFVGIPAIIAYRNAKNAVERKMFFKALMKQFIYLTALGFFGCFAGWVWYMCSKPKEIQEIYKREEENQRFKFE